MAGRRACVIVLLGALACSSPGAPSDAGSDADAGTDAAVPVPTVPQVQNQHGPVMSAPEVVPIFFANDNQQAALEDFLKQLAASSFWGQATSEYGAGALTIGSSIVVSDTPPASINVAGIESWLEGYAASDAGSWPAITPNTIFAILYPQATTVSDPLFGTSCTDFNGFHYEGSTNTNLVYVVLPRCPSAGALTGLDALTGSLSHEIIEAATDPLLVSNPGWAFTDTAHLIWSFLPGAEIGDMCALEPQSFQRLVGSYVVQRPWSNASALAGHDPCVPRPSQPYFNAAPVFTTNANIAFDKQYVSTQGIQIPLGQSRTVAVRLFSDAPTSAWTVQAMDTTSPAGLSFSWDAQTGNDGDVLHLTITRNAASSDEFILESTSGATYNLWFGFVAD